jgi:transcriptional regulator with XRE-family HTH domain
VRIDNKVSAKLNSKAFRPLLGQKLLRVGNRLSSQESTLRFGSALYNFRNAVGLTQEMVAIRSGLTRGYYSQLENSKRVPPPSSTLHKISAALQLSESQMSMLRHFADVERCALLGIPKELPADMVVLLKLLVSKAYQLSPQRLRQISEFVAEETAM